MARGSAQGLKVHKNAVFKEQWVNSWPLGWRPLLLGEIALALLVLVNTLQVQVLGRLLRVSRRCSSPIVERAQMLFRRLVCALHRPHARAPAMSEPRSVLTTVWPLA